MTVFMTLEIALYHYDTNTGTGTKTGTYDGASNGFEVVLELA